MSSQASTELPMKFAASDLHVYLLGPPSVEWAGGSLSIPRRQTRALLYRLAARLDAVPREHLCFLFWPDTYEPTARRNISRLLTHLRRALHASEVLVASSDWVKLDSQRVWSDTATFEWLCHASRPGRQCEELGNAVELYRGPFLAGFSLPDRSEFEAWAMQERQVWERLYLDALSALIEEHAAQGRYEAAITYAQRYLRTNELAEAMHCRLIELYAASGDRNAARRQFEHCSAVLDRELGASPLLETQALYQSVLEGRSLPPESADG